MCHACYINITKLSGIHHIISHCNSSNNIYIYSGFPLPLLKIQNKRHFQVKISIFQIKTLVSDRLHHCLAVQGLSPIRDLASKYFKNMKAQDSRVFPDLLHLFDKLPGIFQWWNEKSQNSRSPCSCGNSDFVSHGPFTSKSCYLPD